MPWLIGHSGRIIPWITERKAKFTCMLAQPGEGRSPLKFFNKRSAARSSNIYCPARVVLTVARRGIDLEYLLKTLSCIEFSFQ